MENNQNIISDADFLESVLGYVDNDNEPEKSQTEQVLDNLLNEPEKQKEETSPTDKEKPDESQKNYSSNKDLEDPLEQVLPKSRFGAKDAILTLIESGEWHDMPIKYGDKEYENIEDLIEKEKPTKELIQSLTQAQKDYKDSLIEETYVKVGDKSSTKAKLVNAILHDVDYSDLLEHNREVIEPLKKVDFNTIPNNEAIAEAFVRQCLVEIDNYHPDSLDAVVEKLRKDFRLIDKATAYQEEYVDKFNREIEKRQIEKTTILQEQEKALKEDMKNLRTTLKTLEFNDRFSGEILKLRYNKDQSGKFQYESVIQDKIQKDKEFEAKLMHFILDEADFIEKAKSKVKNQEQKRVLELLAITPKEKGSTTSKPKGNLQTEDEDFLRELGLV